MSALAFLYDHMRDLPLWFRKLTPGQLEDVASVMTQWQLRGQDYPILPMEEVERREMLRAVAWSGGSIAKAAKALRIGKTTLYNKLKHWGHTVQNRTLLAQASALTGETSRRGRFW